jgi:hypothetical protein
MPAMTRVLVVANRTADSDELLAALLERHAQGSISVTLLAPARYEVTSPHGQAGGLARLGPSRRCLPRFTWDRSRVPAMLLERADRLIGSSTATVAELRRTGRKRREQHIRVARGATTSPPSQPSCARSSLVHWISSAPRKARRS